MEIKALEELHGEDEIKEYLVKTGSIYLAGLTDDGEAVWRTDTEVCSLYAPWYLKLVYEDIDNDIVRLMELGLVEVAGMDEMGEMTFGLTEAGRKAFEQSQ